MEEKEKRQIIDNIFARISTGFQFINDKYLVQQRNAMGPDSAWIRNVYILFSFYFELLLKSAIVLTQSFANKNELEVKLKKLGHNIEVIGRELGNTNLKNLGINKISLSKGEFKIEILNKIIYVKDFNDIRYDFIEGKVRTITTNEDSIIQESLDGAYEIFEKIKYKHFN